MVGRNVGTMREKSSKRGLTSAKVTIYSNDYIFLIKFDLDYSVIGVPV